MGLNSLSTEIPTTNTFPCSNVSNSQEQDYDHEQQEGKDIGHSVSLGLGIYRHDEGDMNWPASLCIKALRLFGSFIPINYKHQWQKVK